LDSYCIISLGWLGQALYKKLNSDNKKVVGSYNKVSKNLSNEFQYDFSDSELPEEILNVDNIIFNLTPTVIGSIDKFKDFCNKIHNKKLVFISSTSVYSQSGEINEKVKPEPKTKNGLLLKECEDYIKSQFKNYLIIRPGGLYDDNRHPAKSLSGKEGLKNGRQAVNLISKNDLVQIITKAIEVENNIIINAVNINHPDKNEYYNSYCKKNNLSAISYLEENDTSRRIIKTMYDDYMVDSDLP
jgi:nucleoside-diphosphate-sugar epimerase